MEAETLKALQGSIEKWQRIVRRTSAVDHGTQNCPLCTMFYEANCKSCPVRHATGQVHCYGSPYDEWSIHNFLCESLTHHHRTPGCKECLRLARAELAFLVRLLPDKDKRHG